MSQLFHGYTYSLRNESFFNLKFKFDCICYIYLFLFIFAQTGKPGREISQTEI